MDLYLRQEKIKLDLEKTFTVVGCGGIGYWVTKYLAMSGVKKINVFDHDVLEESNLNRLDIPFKFIGRNKADIVKVIIKNIRPECEITSFPFKYSNSLGSIMKTDFLIDCTDSLSSQEKNQKIANANNITYIKSGYDGTHISVNDSVAEWGEDTDGYKITPSWVIPATIVAALTVAKVLKYPSKEMSCDIENLFIRK